MKRIILPNVSTPPFLLPFQILLWLVVIAHSGNAQTPPITPSGLNTRVSNPITIDGKTQFDITGGTRAESNLFHSFGDFNVPNKNIANFLNDTGLATDNILGRVTGGNPSNIFGTIQTTGFGDTNLFLMNPAGIVFGPTTSLNIGGSVTFTTADYLRLNDNVRFNAIPNANADALLSTAPIAAYGFLDSTTGAITVQGSQFKVPRGADMSFVGGDITVQSGRLQGGSVRPAHLSASGGQIKLVSVASPGEILANTLEQAPNVSFERLGTIRVSEQSVIDSSGDGGGTIFIRGGHFLLDDSRMSANTTGQATSQLVSPIGAGIDIEVAGDAVIRNGSLIETNVSGKVSPGGESRGIRIKANRIEVRGLLDPDVVATTIQSRRAPGTPVGRGGNIHLEADSVLIQDVGILETLTEGAGDAGNIVLRANNDININFSNLFSGSLSGATGNAGNIEVTSKNGNISTVFSELLSQAVASPGNAGAITVVAPQGDIRLESTGLSNLTFNGGTGVPGGQLRSISVTANNLTLINTTIEGNNFTSPVPGNIQIAVADSLSLSETSSIQGIARSSTPAASLTIAAPNVRITGKSFLSTESKGSGAGGPLNIFTNTLHLTDGAQIRSGSGTGVDPLTGQPVITSGSGGTIAINSQADPSKSVLIDGPESGIFTDANGLGAGGTIDLSARLLTIRNGGAISASTTGIDQNATGGLIRVTATDQVTMTNRASITASSVIDPKASNSGLADAGSIKINAGQQLEVLDNSSITTQAGKASGGNIDIRAIDRIRFLNSTISTSVLSEDGKGGNIFIDPNVVILEDTQVTAKAVGGAGGNITFVTPLFLADSASLSLLSAKSESGLNGTVTIQSPTSNLSGTVGQLAAKTNPPQVLLQNRCIALAGGEQSTFILAGRDALPSEPGGWLSSPVAMEHWTGEVPEDHVSRLMVRSRGWNTQPLLVMSKDETTVLSLRRLTPPGFLVRLFAVSAATGCSS